MITLEDLEKLDHLRRKDIPWNIDRRQRLQSRVELTVARYGDVRSSAPGDRYAEYVSEMEALTDAYRRMELEEERTVFEIISAIRALPGEVADVIYMRYVLRMSFQRIAHDLHQSESTVYRRHRRGLRLLLGDRKK